VRCACKLGSIAIATLKILLGTVAFVGSGLTQQVSMQHFQLPQFVPPQPRPATERVWPSQTVALIEATVGWARFLAGRAAAAIAGAQEALLLAEVAMQSSDARVAGLQEYYTARERELLARLAAVEEERALARRELALKEQWHKTDLAHRKAVREMELDKARQERKKLRRREAALREAQLALGSEQVSACALGGAHIAPSPAASRCLSRLFGCRACVRASSRAVPCVPGIVNSVCVSDVLVCGRLVRLPRLFGPCRTALPRFVCASLQGLTRSQRD
jgi:hypothetical protein